MSNRATTASTSRKIAIIFGLAITIEFVIVGLVCYVITKIG